MTERDTRVTLGTGKIWSMEMAQPSWYEKMPVINTFYYWLLAHYSAHLIRKAGISRARRREQRYTDILLFLVGVSCLTVIGMAYWLSV